MFRSRAALSLIAALLGAIAIAACGSGGQRHGGASGSRTTAINGVHMTLAAANAAMLRFARCMHTHGVNGLPNPVAAPAAFKQSFSNTTPVYRQALGSCQGLIPGQQNDRTGAAHSRRQIDGMLAFARCIRGHGFTRFPDPTSSGQLTHEMLAQAGIDLHQPAVVRAADACVGVTHGVITRALVARFIAGH